MEPVPGYTLSTMAGHFDVFLSHNRRDKATVKRLAEALGERGLRR